MKCDTEESVHMDCAAHYIARGWKVKAHEWIVIPGKEKWGRGDLVFQKGREYIVIEAKRKPHPNVFEQAKFYGAAWKMLYARPGYRVRYGVWTCTLKRIMGTVTDPFRQCRRKNACRQIVARLPKTRVAGRSPSRPRRPSRTL